jgi:Ca2+-binding EF-hand superfamily protein
MFAGCLGLIFLCAVGLPAAFAGQGASPGGQKATPQGPRFDPDRFIKDFDKNGDGKLSKEEAPPVLREHFAEIDTNKDGEISKEELEHHSAQMARRRPAAVEMLYIVVDTPETEVVTVQDLQKAYDFLRKLDRQHDGKIDPKAVAEFRQHRAQERGDAIIKDLDSNHDGKISRDEARGLLREDFDQIDTNKDGFLDRDELRKAFTPVPDAAVPAGERPQKLQDEK